LLDLSDAEQRALVKVARHWPGGGSCLRYALALGCKLRRHRPALVLSARRGPTSSLEAHAWLRVGELRIDFDERRRAAVDFVPLRASATAVP
jgi:hypothetical protein